MGGVTPSHRKHHRRYQGRFTRLASLARSLTTLAAAALLLVLAVPLVTMPMPAQAQGNAQSATYTVTFTGKFTDDALASGVSVPSGEHFTTLIGAVHNGSVTFWSDGGTASAGIESMAEVGGTSNLKSEINAASSNALAVIEQSIAFGGTATATVDITLTTDHPLVTLTSMVAPSPDWFVGVSGLSLRNTADDGWQPSLTVNLFPWDAGTEDGTEFSLSNSPTSPQGTITSIKGTGKFSNEPIATLTFDLQGIPEITTASPILVPENETAVATLTASDDDTPSDQLTWTIPSGTDGGADADHFTLSEGGILAFSAAKNYENPDDTDTDRTYEVTVQVSDGDNPVTADILVTMQNVLELLSAVSGPSSGAYAENSALRVATYTASSPEDNGEVVWSLSGDDSGNFSIDDGVLRFHIDPISPNVFLQLPDFEDPADADTDNIYSVTVTASDNAATPTTVTWAASGEDRDAFAIGSTGVLSFVSPPDFENPSDADGDNVYTVGIVAADGSATGLAFATVVVANVELPEFPSATMTRSVAENTGPGVSIGAPVTATTVGAAVTYTLGGTDAASFDIVEATGQLQTKAALDYETRSSYEVTVTATNLEGSVDIMVTIDVTNVIELQPLAVTTCSGGMAGTYPCRNVDLMSFLALADIGGGSANDVWGWTDSSTGKEYAIMGRTNGTSFVDISDPVNPIYLGNLPPHSDDSTGRDIKVYADHAFIVTEANNSGMQVFDLTQLRMVASPPATFSETAHYPDFSDAHNLAINEESGFAYAVGTNTCSGGLHMINIQTPTNPTSAACFSGDGYTHDAQCVIYDGPDLDHKRKEICFNSNEDTLTIVDVTNKAGPVMLSRTGYSGSRYAHQGWLTEDQVYFLLGDELDEANNPDVTNTRTYMWDVSDLDDPALIGSHDSTTTAIDHNQYVKGNYTYQSNYQAGLRILDITDIANGNLSEAAFFDVNPGSDPTNTDGGTWSNYPFFDSGIVIVSVIEQGLFILRPNLVDGVNPALSSASVNGAALTLTYGEALDEGSRPAPGDFTVQVDGSGRSVSGVSVSGRVVTLTLASVVAHDETVTVSYSPGANPIRDAAGNGAIGLSNEPVANETPETALPNMWLNPTKSDPVASVRSEATYTVTFQGAWNTTVTAGGVPSGGHFTTLIGGVHNAEVTFLKEGGMATAGVEIMAELGGTGTLTNEVRAAEPNALSVLQGSAGNIGPTGSSTINMVTLTTDHPRVTLLSMVVPSPDWFVGVSGLSLLDAGADWLPSQTVNLYPWDAGTEEGTEFSLTNSATSPQEIITSLRGIGKFSNERIATLTFTRQAVNTAPSFTGDTRFEADENQTAAGRVAAADPDSGDGVTYAITGGADASKFGIGETTGVLTFQVPPNYERAADVASADPVNGAGNNEYIVTVTATGGTGDRAMTTEQTITATVRNVEEAGTISFSQVGSAIRARLSDPDGGVNGATWQWARSSNRNTGWTHIGGATSARYTPSSGDQGMYLQATVSYDDAHSSGKQAQGISATQIAPPNLRVATLVSGLSIPWDIAFTPDGTMLFTQRAGVLSSRLADGTVQTIDADFGDLFASGETGLMGIVVDPAFVSNRRFYTCQGHTGPEIQVIAWTLNAAYTQATRVADPLVGGLPASSDRHGGCRLRFGPEGYLWIATGDAASGTLPQDLTSLGGKVLRVDASTGAGAPTNPFAPSRVYTYGHRNVQGLALRPGTSQMWSVEHGPSVDDEINRLVAGRNYGWNPVPGYNESVPHDRPRGVPGCRGGQVVVGVHDPGYQRGHLPGGQPVGRLGGATGGGHARGQQAAPLRVHPGRRLCKSAHRARAQRRFRPAADPDDGPRRSLVCFHLKWRQQRPNTPDRRRRSDSSDAEVDAGLDRRERWSEHGNGEPEPGVHHRDDGDRIGDGGESGGAGRRQAEREQDADDHGRSDQQQRDRDAHRQQQHCGHPQQDGAGVGDGHQQRGGDGAIGRDADDHRRRRSTDGDARSDADLDWRERRVHHRDGAAKPDVERDDDGDRVRYGRLPGRGRGFRTERAQDADDHGRSDHERRDRDDHRQQQRRGHPQQDGAGARHRRQQSWSDGPGRRGTDDHG